MITVQVRTKRVTAELHEKITYKYHPTMPSDYEGPSAVRPAGFTQGCRAQGAPTQWHVCLWRSHAAHHRRHRLSVLDVK